MDLLACSQFSCSQRNGNFCCVFCPDPCENRCLNHPERCGLAKTAEPRRSPSTRQTAHKLSSAEVTELKRLLRNGEFTNGQIAKKFGVSPATVTWHKKRL